MRLHDAAQAAWFEGFLEKLFPRQTEAAGGSWLPDFVRP